MLGKVPDESNLQNKTNNDVNGYFDCAKKTLLNNPKKLITDIVEYTRDYIPAKAKENVMKVVENGSFSLE